MKTAEKVISGIIEKLDASTNNVSLDKLLLAKDLYWARNVINWKLTSYKGWINFCKKHVKLEKSTVCKYIRMHELILKYKYTEQESAKIYRAIGWSCFVFGLLSISRRITVKLFISRYTKIYGSNEQRPNMPEGDRAYTFSLPFAKADKFDIYLRLYGMTTNGRGRRGVRAAMLEIIDQKL